MIERITERVQSPLDRPERRPRRTVWLAVALTVAVHGLLLLGILVTPETSRTSQARQLAEVTEMFEVELEPPPPAPEEPPAPEPEPEPPPPPPVRPRARPAPRPVPAAPPPPPAEPPPAEPPPEPATPPPEAAAAAKTLTAEPVADAPTDTLVQGSAPAAAGGVTQAGGTSQQAVRDTRARAHGVPEGTGTAPPTVDRSRPAGLASGHRWKCPFPREADLSGIDEAKVTLAVEFAVDGTVAGISVQDDPGDGFGREARRCALRTQWRPPLDRAGKPRAGKALVRVRFTR